MPSIAMADPRVPMLVMQRVAGVQGQDLIEHGRASHVLGLLGSALAMLRRLPTSVIPGLSGGGSVVVHGDFGPQNVLADDQRISGLLDWEFARLGEPADVTLAELHLEACLPADDRTAEVLRRRWG